MRGEMEKMQWVAEAEEFSIQSWDGPFFGHIRRT